MANFHFTCPHCSHTMELPDTLLGKQEKCSACREVVLVTKTNCPEQVVSNRSDTKSRIVELEGSLAEVLFAEDSPTKADGPLNQIWEEQRQLNDRLERTQSILDRLGTVLPEVENRQNAHRNATKQLKRVKADIVALQLELGQAAFQAVLAGNIARDALFEERIALQERLAELQSQKAEIDESAKADWKDHLKSKSQYMKVTVQIKVESLKVGGLHKTIGRTLLTDGIEETMRCSETSAVLDRVRIKRAEQKDAVEVETAARTDFSDILQTVSAIVQASSFESVASVQTEIKNLKRQLNEISKLLAKNRSVMLEAAHNDETLMKGVAVGAQLTELAGLKTRLEETKPGLSDIAKIASTGWEQISRRRKSVAGVAITLLLVGIVWVWANQEDGGQLEIAASKTNSPEETNSPAEGSSPTPRSSVSPSATQDGMGADVPGNFPPAASFDDPAGPLSDPATEGSQLTPDDVGPDPAIEAERIAAAKREAERVAAAKREAEAERVAAAKREAARVAAAKREAERVAERQRNPKLTAFDKRARDFTVTLKKIKGERMTLGMGVADFRNKFPGVVLKAPTNPNIPKDAGVWSFVETPTHLRYEEVQGSFVDGRLFQLRKTYGAGSFARNDPDAFGANGDVKKGFLQLIEDIGDAYGMTTVTKTTTTANGESVIHREFPLVHIHMEVQMDRRGKIHVLAQKLDIKRTATKPNTKTAAASDNPGNAPPDAKGDVDSVKSDAGLGKRDASKAVTLEGHLNFVNSVAFSPASKRIVSGSSDETLKLWDAKTGKEIQTLKGHSNWVMSVAYSPDGKRIVSGSADTTLKLWDAETGEEIQTLKGHLGWVESVAYSPDGKRIVSGSADTTLKLWDTKTGKEIQTLNGHSGDVVGAAYSPDGKRIVSSSHDRTIKIWDAETGEEIQTLKGHLGWVVSVAYSPDGKRIVSGSADGTLKLWDAKTGKELHTLEGHSGAVRNVAFSPDGKVIGSGDDQTWKVWDVATGNELHSAAGSFVGFTPDGNYIFGGVYDKSIRIVADLAAEAERVAAAKREAEGVAAANRATERVAAAKREAEAERVAAAKREASRVAAARTSGRPKYIKTPQYIELEKRLFQAVVEGELTGKQSEQLRRRAQAKLKLEGETPGEYYRRQLQFLLDHGTRQEREDTASLVNAIEKARVRGLNAVSPDMRREVARWLPLVTQE